MACFIRALAVCQRRFFIHLLSGAAGLGRCLRDFSGLRGWWRRITEQDLAQETQMRGTFKLQTQQRTMLECTTPLSLHIA